MISEILNRLTAAGLTAAPSSDAQASRADTVPSLVQLVDPVVASALWPLNLPSDAPATNGVYQLAAWSEVDVDGYRLGRVDTYVLSLRAAQFDPLREMTDSLIARVSSHRGVQSWDITDAATEYEYEQRQYMAHFELQCATLAMAAPALPAAFVHAIAAAPSGNALDTRDVRQTVTEQLAVVLVADQDDIESLRRRTSTALLGAATSPDGVSPLEYQAGQPVAISGRLVFWREVYSYQRLIRSA
jgi:hypothetical protein